jgi:Tfp pilus assembly protein FimV
MSTPARIYRFPTEEVRGRVRAETRARIARKRRMLARRRRAGLAFVALSVVLLGVFGGGAQGSAPAAPGSPRSVIVKPGQSVWDIAERFAPESVDVRAYVDAILERNGGDPAIPAGTRIALPR